MNDMTLKEAVSALQNQGRAFKAVMVIADAIESVDDLERQIGEANARLSAKAGEEAVVDGKIAEAKAKLVSENGRINKAETKAAELVADAEAKHEFAINQAKDTAADIVRIAKEEAKSIKDEAAKFKASADAAVRDKQAELSALDEKISNSAAELVEVEAKIEKARETIKQMMGG